MTIHCKVGPSLVPLAFLILPYLFVIAVLLVQHAHTATKVFAFGFWVFYAVYASTTKRDGFEVKKEHLGAVFSDGLTVGIPFTRAPLAGIKKITFQAPPSFFPDFESAFPGVLPSHLRAASSQAGPPSSPAIPPIPSTAFKSPCKRATLSLGLGIAGILIGPLASIPAVIYGLLALREIRDSAGGLNGKRHATAGTIAGVIGTVGWIIFVVVMESGAK
jgi:hypothetical protein